MKLARPLLIGIGVMGLVCVVAVGIAFSSSFQTWAARRALNSQPETSGTIGSVSAGLHRVEIKTARIVQDGAILTLPALEAELPVIAAAMNHRVALTRLVAKGWVLDLSNAKPAVKKLALAARVQDPFFAASPAIPRGREFSWVGHAYAAEPSTTLPPQFFQGVFTQLKLPIDLALDGLDLEGEVILPAAAGQPAPRVKVTLQGGGLAAGKEGAFDFTAAANTAAGVAPISAHALRGTFGAAMDTPRTFTRLVVKAEASVSGTQFPRGVKLSVDLAALRDADGENYTLALAGEGKPLAGLRAAFPLAAGGATAESKLTGTWTLNLRDGDLAPFTLGFPLPAFEATGEGAFASDAAFVAMRASGKLDATVNHLAAIMPELAVIGPARIAATFDLGRRGDALGIERLTAEFSSAGRSVAAVTALQAFEFNPKTGELTADPLKDLLGVALHGVPLAWAQPFVSGITFSGGDLTGELVASAGNGGLTMRAKTPLTIANVSVAQAGKPLLRRVDFALDPAADYTPQGWQVVLAPSTAKSEGVTLLTWEGKAGKIAGKDRPIKATGRLALNLSGILRQPMAGESSALTAGDATVEFSASLAEKQEIQAHLVVDGLATDPKVVAGTLPSITTDLRADREADGQIAFSVPLIVERDGHKSDLNLSGTLLSGKSGVVFDGHVTSALLMLEDVQILTAPFGSGAAPSPAAKSQPAESAPPWAGISGKATLALKRVVYSETFQVADVGGTLRLEAGAVKLEGVRAVMGEGGAAKLDGGLVFNAKNARPYALALDLAVNEFDPAPFFRALNPGQPPTVEGKFNLSSKLVGQAATLDELGAGLGGDFQLASKEGIFRGLPVNVAAKTELTSRIAAGVASLGNLVTSLTGKSDKELADITNIAQAVAELTKFWQAIAYDQLSVVLSRDSSLNTVLKDFTLIAPEIRLTGTGQATHQPNAPFLDEALAMELKLRARGHHAELLKYIGVLDAQPDPLGYVGCTLPLKVAGTLGKPDTSELQRTLENIVLEKTGVTDKASEMLNKLLGK